MRIVDYADVQEFWKATRAFYEADPLRHTIALTVLRERAGAVDPGDVAVMIALFEGDQVVGATFQTPPHPLAASGIAPNAVAPLVSVLRERNVPLPGVLGSRDIATAFAEAWMRERVVEHMTTRLHRLDVLVPPTDAPGHLMLAGDAELPTVGNWLQAFDVEAHGRPPSESRHVSVHGRSHGLWIVDGKPVAYASASEPQAGASRIGPVYTPPEQRKHGYGSAVTAAMAQWALGEGAQEVLLFTDLANPTSNKIYSALGFVPVYDSVEFRFPTTVA